MEARANEGARLMEWGFRSFEDDKILAKDQPVGSAKVWLGAEKEVPLVADHDVLATIPIAQKADVKMTVSYNGPVEAPIKKGTPIGKLHIVIPDQPEQDVDLVAGQDVERQGIFGRAYSRAHMLIYGM